MNPRIKELAEDAGFCFWEDEDWKPHGAIIDWSAEYDKEFQKYTELLINECLDICQNHYTIEGIAQNIEKDIKEKFGIKEIGRAHV